MCLATGIIGWPNKQESIHRHSCIAMGILPSNKLMTSRTKWTQSCLNWTRDQSMSEDSSQLFVGLFSLACAIYSACTGANVRFRCCQHILYFTLQAISLARRPTNARFAIHHAQRMSTCSFKPDHCALSSLARMSSPMRPSYGIPKANHRTARHFQRWRKSDTCGSFQFNWVKAAGPNWDWNSMAK